MANFDIVLDAAPDYLDDAIVDTLGRFDVEWSDSNLHYSAPEGQMARIIAALAALGAIGVKVIEF